jgi:hypothetical protein
MGALSPESLVSRSHGAWIAEVNVRLFPVRIALVAAALTVLCCICLRLLSQIIMVKARIVNTSSPSIFSARKLPGFIEQSQGSEALGRFRRHLDQVLSVEYQNSLAKVVAIRCWVRRQQSQDRLVWLTPAGVTHEDPHRLLKEIREGLPGSCRRFSYILLGALLSAGFDARIVGFTNSLNRRDSKQHLLVEVWLEELGQWVLLDPTFDTLITVGGKVASAIELHLAIADADPSRIAFARERGALIPHPRLELFEFYCRHMFVAMSNAIFDGYAIRILGQRRIQFFHFSHDGKYPEVLKHLLLVAACCSLFLGLLFWVSILLTFLAA